MTSVVAIMVSEAQAYDATAGVGAATVCTCGFIIAMATACGTFLVVLRMAIVAYEGQLRQQQSFRGDYLDELRAAHERQRLDLAECHAKQRFFEWRGGHHSCAVAHTSGTPQGCLMLPLQGLDAAGRDSQCYDLSNCLAWP